MFDGGAGVGVLMEERERWLEEDEVDGKWW
jgi:hypothetical protein